MASLRMIFSILGQTVNSVWWLVIGAGLGLEFISGAVNTLLLFEIPNCVGLMVRRKGQKGMCVFSCSLWRFPQCLGLGCLRVSNAVA